MNEPKKLFLCLPLYNRQVDVGTAQRYFMSGSRDVEIDRSISRSSLLAFGFNKQWLQAISGGYDYFLMLHGDVEPVEHNWVDILLDEMRAHHADIMAAVVPIKSEYGITSTAIGEPDDPWTQTRLAFDDLQEYPETFNSNDLGRPDAPLLVNTGCLLVDLSQSWIRRVRFEIQTRITGNLVECESEDWYFSRLAHEGGAKTFATRKVHVLHHGEHAFLSPPGTPATPQRFDPAAEGGT